VLHISALLTPREIGTIRDLTGKGVWIDGRATAGHLSARVKRNRQLGEEDAAGLAAGAIILAALGRSGVFASAALPRQISAPLFSRCEAGEGYGDHIDSAIRPLSQGQMRLDLSATVFLSEPNAYEGGALVINTGSVAQSFKLPAGDMLLYAADTIHRVEPVESGERAVAFFWVQSMIRAAADRDLLFALDQAIQSNTSDPLPLAQIYHNLLRRWAEP
jgi:PKHD-type hydroxylase